MRATYVYIVQCADGTLYTGTAKDVNARVQLHNHSKRGAKYTKARRPVTIVYMEGPLTLTLALKREYQIKQLCRAEKINLIERNRS